MSTKRVLEPFPPPPLPFGSLVFFTLLLLIFIAKQSMEFVAALRRQLAQAGLLTLVC